MSCHTTYVIYNSCAAGSDPLPSPPPVVLLGVLQVQLDGAGGVLQEELALGELCEHSQHEHLLQTRGGAEQQLHGLQAEAAPAGRRSARLGAAEQFVTETPLVDQVIAATRRDKTDAWSWDGHRQSCVSPHQQ